MDHGTAALEQAGGKAGDVTDRTAAQRDDRGAAPHVAQGEAVGDCRQRRPILRRFPLRNNDRRLENDRGKDGAVKGQHASVGD